jgi:putative RNA 2'-phosphotransferase
MQGLRDRGRGAIRFRPDVSEAIAVPALFNAGGEDPRDGGAESLGAEGRMWMSPAGRGDVAQARRESARRRRRSSEGGNDPGSAVMPITSNDLHKRMKRLALSGPGSAVRRIPDFDEHYLIRCLSYLLRHAAGERGVEIDGRGWAALDDVARATRRMHETLGEITTGRLIDFVLRRADDRFEVYGDRIRARYGHSIAGVAVAAPTLPPKQLFHGTTAEAWASIRESGLRPMGRSHVHLTTDVAYARHVAEGKSAEPIVIHIRAREAWTEGATFRRASWHVWLADEIAPCFCRL